MIILVLLLLVAILCAILLLWLITFYRAWRHLKNVPAPPTYPILGNMFEFKSLTDTIVIFDRLFEKYNTKILRMTIGLKTMLVVKDYDFLEFLLSSNKILDKSVGYTFLFPWLGTGLLTAGGEKWRKHRKMLTPSFHFQILEQFVDVFNSCGKVLVEKLNKEVGKGSTDIFPFLNLYALDVICETAMGTSANAQNQENSPYVQCVKDMCRIIQERSFSLLQHFDVFFRLTAGYKDQTKALKILHGYTNSVIRQRREQLLAKGGSAMTDETGAKKRIAFLDLILGATIDGRPLTDQEIREEVDTFMFAGHDTTSTGMSFILYALANNPEAQQKTYEEIREVLGDDRHAPVTFKDLQNLKYMEMVIKESMRLYPPVPFFVRKTVQDVQYKDFTIPNDCALNVYVLGIHKDPEYFPEPEKFNPERFAENKISKFPYAYIPFSAGPRNCIGQKFAMVEMKATLAKVLRNFELKPVVPAHKLILSAETILKATNGILIKVEKRM